MMYKMLSRQPMQRSMLSTSYIVAPKVFTPEEAASIIEIGKATELIEAGTGQGHKDKKIRDSKVSFIASDVKTDWIFKKLDRAIEWANEHYFGFDINGYERFQFTEYKSKNNGHYNWHMDTQFSPQAPCASGMRKISASVLLNENYEGGQFQINGGDQTRPISVQAATGDAIIFPSFISHRVAPMIKGSRYSIVAWVLGPKFI